MLTISRTTAAVFVALLDEAGFIRARNRLASSFHWTEREIDAFEMVMDHFTERRARKRGEGRNPFFLGNFDGMHLRRARTLKRIALATGAACLFATIMAVRTFAIAPAPHMCRVSIVDDAGEEYVIGQGDTLEAAMKGAALPNFDGVYVFDGCER